ncbi:MAG: NAD(P)H-dependent oxidoreductase subunit E [Actinobacteria bacterium]|nr:NAD(P)H-dependent oxidoreductase subunit E [Actinomycetota bacterium]
MTPPANSVSLPNDIDKELTTIADRYTHRRSAILPMLHLVQSYQGWVSPEGIEACARVLGISPAEVSGVSTFYTMYRRRPCGKHLIGVCTTSLCGMLGGDAVLQDLREYLSVDENGDSPDGMFTVEHIECQAACSQAPVVTIDWEFFQYMTPWRMHEVVADLRDGKEVKPDRGSTVRGFREVEKVLAGMELTEPTQPAVDDAMLAGLMVAKGKAKS